MYKHHKKQKTSLKINTSYEGERIEQKIHRILNNKEPIKDGAPKIYTERKHGVRPEYDIRTDRFEVAVDAMDYVTKSHLTKREHRLNESNKQKDTDTQTQTDSGAETTQATKTE